MTNFTTLSLWMRGVESLSMFTTIDKIQPFFEYGSFIGISEHCYLHDVNNMPAQSLSNSWDNTKKYVDEAIELIDGTIDERLDNDDAYFIELEKGKPPEHCYPIYIITVEDEHCERVVYIGKTSSEKNRFSGGHRVAIKLHDPKYNGLIKNVYFCCAVFLTEDKKYLPLEWIHPKKKALELLDSIESHLIYIFSPELNIQKKNKNYSKYEMYFHIQNFSGYSNFLNDKFI